jgi:nitroreductase
MQLDDAIYNRRSIREFSDKKVKWHDVLEAIDAACQAPCAGNINHLKYMIVTKQDTKDSLAKNSQQLWIAEAPYLVIICSDPNKLEQSYDKRGADMYSRQQTGAAIQNILLKLTELKLGSCWVGAYSDKLCKKCLKIPEEINIEAIIAIGYPKPHIKIDKPKKPNLENITQWESWGTKKKPKK